MSNGHAKLPGEILAETIMTEQRRSDLCLAEINQALKKYDCVLEPVLHLSRHGVSGEVQVTAIPRMIKPVG